MSFNTFGHILRLTTFGESHGPMIGGVLDGVPPGFTPDKDAVQQALDLRRPGSSRLTSQRREPDRVEFVAGLAADGRTLGSPLAFIIRNEDARPADYDGIEAAFRPNHADMTYRIKYGMPPGSGGGRASARETACRVAAGAIAAQLLTRNGVEISAYISQIGAVRADNPYPAVIDAGRIRHSAIRTAFAHLEEAMQAEVERARDNADSVGGRVSCRITGLPAGLGEPVYGKLQAQLAAAMMSINAAKSFEYGQGACAAGAYGSQSADIPEPAGTSGGIRMRDNFSGGIQGGISNGEPVEFSVAFKPTPTIPRETPTVDINGRATVIHPRGRHDPCVAIRAVPVVAAMAALTIADAFLMAGFDLGNLRS